MLLAGIHKWLVKAGQTSDAWLSLFVSAEPPAKRTLFRIFGLLLAPRRRLVTLETAFHSTRRRTAVSHARSLPGQADLCGWGQQIVWRPGSCKSTIGLTLLALAVVDQNKLGICHPDPLPTAQTTSGCPAIVLELVVPMCHGRNISEGSLGQKLRHCSSPAIWVSNGPGLISAVARR